MSLYLSEGPLTRRSHCDDAAPSHPLSGVISRASYRALCSCPTAPSPHPPDCPFSLSEAGGRCSAIRDLPHGTPPPARHAPPLLLFFVVAHVREGYKNTKQREATVSGCICGRAAGCNGRAAAGGEQRGTVPRTPKLPAPLAASYFRPLSLAGPPPARPALSSCPPLRN